MTRLEHPAFRDVTREVPDADAADWIAAGWLATPNQPTVPVPPTDTLVGDLTGDDQANQQ